MTGAEAKEWMIAWQDVIFNWPVVIEFYQRIQAVGPAPALPIVVPGETMIGHMFTVAGVVFAVVAIPIYLDRGVLPVLFQTIGASLVCGLLVVLRRRQSTLFDETGIRAKRMFTTTQYTYGDIKRVRWGVFGRTRFGIFTVFIGFRNGSYVEAEFSDDLAAALAYTIARVEAEGRDTSGWLPTPDRFGL